MIESLVEQFSDGRGVFLLLYTIAFSASVLAFTRRSMVALRSLVVVSSFSYVLYYALFPAEPLWLDIITESAAVIINSVMIFVLIHQDRGLGFTEEEKELYAAYFGSLSAFEFMKLKRLASWHLLEKKAELTRQGAVQEELHFLYDGEVEIVQDGIRVKTLEAGSFIGEISFTLDRPANASVLTVGAARVLSWSQAGLKEMLSRNPGLEGKFSAMINTDLASKLSFGRPDIGAET